MNVFEDLIEELRDENLLENTVIDAGGAGAAASKSRRPADASDVGHESNQSARASIPTPGADEEVIEESDGEVSERDFYRKRAMDEISSLQMVEHILSGIEREHMKSVPASYDNLEAKKALHRFLQVEGDTTSTEYAEAEFNLMRETEAWNSVLLERDRKITVANVRRFCEDSRPPLSSQAVRAMARFYRNAPFSELTRAKFEVVMTRLFSREVDGGKRRLLFGRAEMIGHIKTLYANWASVALYSADDLSLKSRTLVAGFDGKVMEAEAAQTFGELVQNDFFKKVHEFKEATGEMFFTPEVVGATIDCNTKIGNKFVDLVRIERDRANLESLEQKYGYEHDQDITNATSKTMELVEVFRNLPEDEEEVDVGLEHQNVAASTYVSPKLSEEKRQAGFKLELFSVNKWLLVATIIIVAISGVLYFWANQSATQSSSAESASDVSVEGSELKDYVRSVRSTPSTLYAITLPSWDTLSDDKKSELLKKALELASKTGQKNVQFVNVRGRVEAFATVDKIDIMNP